MNNKDYIKIDDLFKGKPELEEKIPAGSWRNMQDLLDKSAKTGGGNGNKRYGLYALLGLLTLGLGLGAVEYNKALSPIANQTTPLVTLAEHTGNTVVNSSVNNKVNQPEEQITSVANSDQLASANTPSEYKKATRNKKQVLPTESNTNALASDARMVVKNQAKEAKLLARDYSGSVASIEGNKKTKSAKTSNRKKAELAQEKVESERIFSSIQTDINPMAIVSIPAVDAPITETLIAQNKSESVASSTSEPASEYKAVIIDTVSNKKFVLAKGATDWQKEITAPVTEYKTVVRYEPQEDGSAQSIFDTVSVQQYQKQKLASLSKQERMSLQELSSTTLSFMPKKANYTNLNEAAKIVANYTENQQAEASSTLVSLEQFKVKTSQNKNSFASRFYDMLNKYFDGQNPYYFGFNLGGQYQLSNPSHSGFNLGAGAYYQFRERYILGLEVQYLNNSFSNKILNDEYNIYTDPTQNNTGSQTVFSALEQKFSNQYLLKRNHYIHVPLTLRYQLSKLSLMGGAYASFMSATQKEANLSLSQGEARRVYANTPFQSTNASVSETDFKARMAAGFTIGAAYDFSRHWSVDFRINQNIWQSKPNNNSLMGNVYQATGAQLSLFYFIGKKDKVIYMMNGK